MTPKQARELRQKMGLSQVEMARCLGISRERISRWENGETIGHNVNNQILQGISDAVKFGDPVWIGKRLRAGLAVIITRGLQA